MTAMKQETGEWNYDYFVIIGYSHFLWSRVVLSESGFGFVVNVYCKF